MKKIICTLAVATVLVTSSLSAFVINAEKKTQAAEEVETLVCGYEDHYDLNTLMPYTFFGKVELESDKAYISEGDYSAKFTIQSDKFDGAFSNMTYVFQALKNVSKGVDKTDATNLKKIKFDIYNSSSKSLRMGVRLVYYRRYYGDNRSNIKYVTLSANAWTTVEYTVDYGKIPVTTLEGGAEKYVIGLDYLFYIPTIGESDVVYYIDNVRVCE